MVCLCVCATVLSKNLKLRLFGLISEYLIVAGSGFLESALKDTKPCLRLLRKSEEYLEAIKGLVNIIAIYHTRGSGNY